MIEPPELGEDVSLEPMTEDENPVPPEREYPKPCRVLEVSASGLETILQMGGIEDLLKHLLECINFDEGAGVPNSTEFILDQGDDSFLHVTIEEPAGIKLREISKDEAARFWAGGEAPEGARISALTANRLNSHYRLSLSLRLDDTGTNFSSSQNQ